MIRSPTTLVLGAGASAPFGYPVGARLTEMLKQGAQPGAWLWDVLIGAGFTEERVAHFRAELRKSQRLSIDAFLEDWAEDFMEVGKTAIAAVLMEFENPDKLIDEPDWYRRLFHTLTDRGSFEGNQLSVITFNYDRSFEFFLATCLPARFRIPKERAVDWLRKQPILHVYGDLGPLPEFELGGRRYGDAKRQVAEIKAAAAGIHLVRGGLSPPSFERARQFLRDAERVVILGFGFDRANCIRLALHDVIGAKDVIATMHDVEQVDNLAIKKTVETGKGRAISWQYCTALEFMCNVGL